MGALFRFHSGPKMLKNPDFHGQTPPEAPPKILVGSKSAWLTSFDSLEVQRQCTDSALELPATEM